MALSLCRLRAVMCVLNPNNDLPNKTPSCSRIIQFIFLLFAASALNASFLSDFFSIESLGAEELKPAKDTPTRLPEERRVIDLYKRVHDAVVFISTRSIVGDPLDAGQPMANQGASGAGTGIIIDAEQRILLTNLHVISDATSIRTLLADGKHYQARLVGHDPEYDIAVLQLAEGAGPLTAIPFGNSKDLEIGQNVYAIGNPHGLERTLTSGIVSSLHRTVRNPSNFLMKDLIQTDASINPGNSGGPLLDLDGRLVGLNTAIVSQSGDSAGIGFAVPVHRIARILPELIATGKVLRPRIGWILMDTNVGPIVRRVIPDSPAARAGLQPLERSVGDVFAKGYVQNFDTADLILTVNGKRVNLSEEVERLVKRSRRGEVITLHVQEAGNSKRKRKVLIKPVLK